MTKNKPNINLRSEGVQEIMTRPPSWMIRWGISFSFVLLLILFLITWFVKYPDVISGNATVSTKEAVVVLVSKNSGEIVYLIDEHQRVAEGDLISSIKAILSEEAKDYLDKLIIEVESGLNSEEMNIQFEDKSLKFGSLQEDYSELKKAILEHQYFLKNSTLAFEIQILNEQIGNHQRLKSISNQQIEVKKRQFELNKSQFESTQRLFEKGVISKQKLVDEQLNMTTVENELSNLKKTTVENSIMITNLKSQSQKLKSEFDLQYTTRINTIKSLLLTIKNSLEQWKENYEIRAPSSGKLSYLNKININEFIEVGRSLFAIVPENQEYIGYIKVSRQGYGKIKKGQKVRINLDSYPSHEYGLLDGKVISIAVIPHDEQYLIKFSLIKGLVTSYNKKVEYTPEMTGSAQIITEDLRLIERFLHKFKSIID